MLMQFSLVKDKSFQVCFQGFMTKPSENLLQPVFFQSVFKYLNPSFYDGNAKSPLNIAATASLFPPCI